MIKGCKLLRAESLKVALSFTKSNGYHTLIILLWLMFLQPYGVWPYICMV